MSDFLRIECSEWQVLAEQYPLEMEVIMTMMIEAEADICA
jgi:hypothetical protein